MLSKLADDLKPNAMNAIFVVSNQMKKTARMSCPILLDFMPPIPNKIRQES